MTKIVKAEYDAEHRTLRLLEPLDGYENGEQVTAVVNKADPQRPWLALQGVLHGEDGEAFARAIEEAFPIEK